MRHHCSVPPTFAFRRPTRQIALPKRPRAFAGASLASPRSASAFFSSSSNASWDGLRVPPTQRFGPPLHDLCQRLVDTLRRRSVLQGLLDDVPVLGAVAPRVAASPSVWRRRRRRHIQDELLSGMTFQKYWLMVQSRWLQVHLRSGAAFPCRWHCVPVDNPVVARLGHRVRPDGGRRSRRCCSTCFRL